MLILLGCMAGEIGVEGDECNGLDGLGGKQGSSPSFRDAFFTNQAQNRPLQVFYKMSTRCSSSPIGSLVFL